VLWNKKKIIPALQCKGLNRSKMILILCSNLLTAVCAMYICKALLEIKACFMESNIIHSEIRAFKRERSVINSFLGNEMCNRLTGITDAIQDARAND
jgi:hypothetical protein